MLIGFAGKAQSGKTTAAKHLKDKFGFRVISFASGIKEECVAFLERHKVPFDTNFFYGDIAAKETEIRIENAAPILAEIPRFLEFLQLRSKLEPVSMGCVFTARDLMQWWGTNYRRRQDYDYWIKRLAARAIGLMAEGYHVAVDDVRFPDEAELIHDLQGAVFYIIRQDRPCTRGSDHASETALDDYSDITAYIMNNGSLEDFPSRVESSVGALHILDLDTKQE